MRYISFAVNWRLGATEMNDFWKRFGDYAARAVAADEEKAMAWAAASTIADDACLMDHEGYTRDAYPSAYLEAATTEYILCTCGKVEGGFCNGACKRKAPQAHD